MAHEGVVNEATSPERYCFCAELKVSYMLKLAPILRLIPLGGPVTPRGISGGIHGRISELGP